MKKSKILVVLILMIMTSCSLFQKPEAEPYYNYTTMKEEPINAKVKEVKNEPKSEILETEDGEMVEYSFWFVVWEIKKDGGRVNSYIAQPHPGFSMIEFKEKHGEGNFVLNLIEVSYETYNHDKNE